MENKKMYFYFFSFTLAGHHGYPFNFANTVVPGVYSVRPC